MLDLSTSPLIDRFVEKEILMQLHKVFCSIVEGSDIRATTVRTRKKFSTETTTLKSRVCPSPHRVESLKKNPKMLHLMGFSNYSITTRKDFWLE